MVKDTLLASIGALLADNGAATAADLRNAFSQTINYVQPKHVYYLSNEGAISDADISDDSVTFGTDNTGVIQAVLNQATSAPILIFWDGKYSATGLTVYSNTTIIAFAGCGGILRNNSNKPFFQNSSRTNTGAFGNSNITIKGGKYNCNAYNPNLSPAQTDIVGGDYETYLPGFKFHGVENLRIDDVTLFKARVYGLWFRNCQNVWSNNCVVDAGANGALHCDGYHFNGPCKWVWVTNAKVRAVDDHLALNADDGYNTFGDITDVFFDNIHFFGGIYGARILSGASRVDRISFKNIYGVTGDYWAVIDNFYQDPAFIHSPGAGNVGTITFENINVKVTSVSPYTYQGCVVVNANCENLIFRDIKRNDFDLANFPTIIISGAGKTVNTLEVDGYTVLQSTVNLVQHFVVKDATVKNMVLNNLVIDRKNTVAQDASNVVLTDGGNIGLLKINGAYVNKHLNLLKAQTGSVGKILAVNVSHENAGGGATFATSVTITKGVFSNVDTSLLTSGTITSKTGDAT